MKALFNSIHQVGFVVKNLKQEVEKFSELYGIKPWNIWEYNTKNVEDMEVYGVKKNYKMMVATCKSMNIDFELIEPLDGESIFSDFIDKFGGGLHHINFLADNYDAVSNYLLSQEIGIIQYGNLSGKHKYAFFDTFQDLNYYIELSTNLPGFKRIKPLYTYTHNSRISITEENSVFKKVGYIGIYTDRLEEIVLKKQHKYLINKWKYFKLINIDNNNNLILENRKKLDYAIDIAISNYFNIKLVVINSRKINSLLYKNKILETKGLHHIGFSTPSILNVMQICKSSKFKIRLMSSFDDTKFPFILTEDSSKFLTCIYEI
jgi:hypothetical protein